MSPARVAITVGGHYHTSDPYREVLEHVGLDVRVLSSADVMGDWDEEASRALADLHGIVMAGGPDIDPALLGGGEAYHPSVYGVDAARDLWERAVFAEAWRRDMPILAVCRGMQVMNWALGGTLWADIDALYAPCGTEKRHRQTDYGFGRSDASQSIGVEPGSRFHQIVQSERIGVNHLHHQSVRDVAPGLVVTARADDGIIEAMEHPGRAFALAVQFHPEEMWRHDAALLRLFAAFGGAAAAFAARPALNAPGRRVR